MTNWLSTSILFILLHSCCAKLFTVEIERFGPRENSIPRSQASNNFTVVMKPHDIVRMHFCLRAKSAVTIVNIVYSNDGPADEIHAILDGETMGSFIGSPYDGQGRGWNLFRSSGPLPGRMVLGTGPHVLVLNVTRSDQYGIEIDNLFLDIDDMGLDYPTLFCSLYCFDDVTYDAKQTGFPKRVPNGRFVQKSFSTHCAEVDNVNVEIYHDSATKFEITANIPKYYSFANYREPFFDNCKLGSPFWAFYNQSVRHRNTMIENQIAQLSFQGNSHTVLLTVTFDMKKISPVREVDETQIRTFLMLRLRNLPRENVLVKPERMGTEGHWVKMKEMTYTPFSTERTWHIPDFSWSADKLNKIRLTIYPGQQDVIVDTLLLQREKTSDTTVDVYADDDIVIQAVSLGFWHHMKDNPNAMTLQGAFENRTEITNIGSIRIYAKVPWTGAYAQVFVLFQNGRARLQAITPHGLDFIPFGSSVNIGQPLKTNSMRPYSAIRRIYIDPRSLRMNVMYENGNSADFILKTSFTDTKLTVENCKFLQNRNNFPVMTFQSMWVNDGNADVDHMNINGGKSWHIMSSWSQHQGTWAAFFRKCISRHNTQAPDIQIKFL